jgi:hypothetical protein
MRMVVSLREALLRWVTQFDAQRGKKSNTLDVQIFLSGLRV